MARPSKLSDRQWAEIEKRHLDGESIRSLAREFKVSESTIRERISAQSAQVKKVANQIVETNQALKALPISAQISAHNRAARLMAIQDATDDAAIAGSITSKRVSEAVQRRVNAQTDDELLDAENMRGVMAAGMVSNTHAKLGIDVMTLAVKQGEGKDGEADKPKPSALTYKVI